MNRSLVVALLMGCSVTTPAGAQPGAQSRAAVRDELWAKEQAIYAARTQGDMSVYRADIADDYLAWPPYRDAPAGDDGLKQTATAIAGHNREKLAMELVACSVNGDAAVIYYRTHRTMRGDGAPADDRFEVTHSWVRQHGAWKLLGGMARATPAR